MYMNIRKKLNRKSLKGSKNTQKYKKKKSVNKSRKKKVNKKAYGNRVTKEQFIGFIMDNKSNYINLPKEYDCMTNKSNISYKKIQNIIDDIIKKSQVNLTYSELEGAVIKSMPYECVSRGINTMKLSNMFPDVPHN